MIKAFSSQFKLPYDGQIVLRIPNPISNINMVAQVLRGLYPDLGSRSSFGLDDISISMTNRGLVTSQGALGAEALRRSTRKDRSRDPIFNQSKMYAEVYRHLGLFVTAGSATSYRYSLLGRYFASALDFVPLMKECLLGLAYPNPAINVRSNNRVRLFACTLRFMDSLDGKLSRKEIILGPMSISNDRDSSEFASVVTKLRKLRNVDGGTDKSFQDLAEELNLDPDTMGNYTRFPIAALKWTGWAVKEQNTFRITDQGRAVLAFLASVRDVRTEDVGAMDGLAQTNFGIEFLGPLARVSFYEMLGRAGFDTAPVRGEIEANRSLLLGAGVTQGQQILFSPFQQLSGEALDIAFPLEAGSITSPELPDMPRARATRMVPRTPIILRQMADSRAPVAGTAAIRRLIREAMERNGNVVEASVGDIFQSYRGSVKERFYPLVADLFRIAGFECELSRMGTNPDRMDARIRFSDDTIPIEIKSPGEEEEISVKAIRQALENKIVLLSRGSFPCNNDTTSLVVGYNPPNARSDIHQLILDIENCFGLHVGIIDFQTLLTIALTKEAGGPGLDATTLKQIRGLAHVDSA